MSVHLLFARLLRPFRWRDPQATARMLMDFARAERSSFFDMMEAANASADPARKAQYVAHAVDEQRHARMFSLRALELDPSLSAAAELGSTDFEHLFTHLGEARFIAFVHVGERRARAQMELFRQELASLENTPRADAKTRALLEAVMKDETRHEAYSLELANTLGGSLAAAQFWELRRGWLRVGATMSGLVYRALMTALYFALFPLKLFTRR